MAAKVWFEVLAALVTFDILAVAGYSTCFQKLPPWSPLANLNDFMSRKSRKDPVKVK